MDETENFDDSTEISNAKIQPNSSTFESSIKLKSKKTAPLESSDSEVESLIPSKFGKTSAVSSSDSDEPLIKFKKNKIPTVVSFDSDDDHLIKSNSTDLTKSLSESENLMASKSCTKESTHLSEESNQSLHDNFIDDENSNVEKCLNDSKKSLGYELNKSEDDLLKSFRNPDQNSSDSDSEIQGINEDSESENDDEVERNVFSPRTRKSMTGIRERDIMLDSSSDEEFLKSDRETPIENICIEDSDEEMSEGIQKLKDPPLDDSVEFVSEEPITKSQNYDISCRTPFQPNHKYVSSTPAKVLQPKITNMVKKYVSQEFYDTQVIKLNELTNDLQRSISLNEKMKLSLPDNGRRLSGRIDKLKDDVERMENYISTLEVQTSINQNPPKQKLKSETPKTISAPSWSDLDAGVNAVQPKYTGKIGMKNFIAAKVMTMERLKVNT